MEWTGGCLCGAVRYRARGRPIGACHCHCERCQRHSGAVFASAMGFADEDVAWTQEEPSRYASSPSAARLFCSTCGSSIAHHWVDIGTLWPYIGTLDEPGLASPEFHIFSLPKSGFPGSSLTTDCLAMPSSHRHARERKGLLKIFRNRVTLRIYKGLRVFSIFDSERDETHSVVHRAGSWIANYRLSGLPSSSSTTA